MDKEKDNCGKSSLQLTSLENVVQIGLNTAQFIISWSIKCQEDKSSNLAFK